jgi:hypothetical protein
MGGKVEWASNRVGRTARRHAVQFRLWERGGEKTSCVLTVQSQRVGEIHPLHQVLQLGHDPGEAPKRCR